MGIEAYGIEADRREYAGHTANQIREIFARVKDYATAIIKPAPTYLGDEIPISGNGTVTYDK
jgi:vancomycin permeability regulator SanA